MSYLNAQGRGALQKSLLGLAMSALVALPSSAAAVPIGTVTVPEHDDHGNQAPVVQGTQGALCQSGVSAGFACRNVEMLSRLPLESVGGGSGADSWGWKDPDTGRYYALFARSNGTSFVDVTDPESPVYLGNLPGTSGEAPWRDVKVYADHAFVVADGIADHGMQVFDLTRLRGLQEPQEFDADALFTGISSAHNVAINEDSGFAYVVGSNLCAGSLYIVDIRSPLAPQFAGCFSEAGYTHDVQCVNYAGPDTDHAGAEVCFLSNPGSFFIVDVTDKASPAILGSADYPQRAYPHQGWLDEAQGLFFLGDELDEREFGTNTRTLVFDVRDLDHPVFVGAHQHGISAIDHNMYVKDNHLYQANYKAGLRILRIDRDAGIALTEVAYFDTVPGSDDFEFGGAWNVYPFFDNGTILVSDMDSGLFMLRAALDTDPAASAPLNGQISGAWVAEGLNDQGIMLFVEELETGPVIFFNWFLFLDGEPFWLTGAQGFAYGDDEVSIPTQRLSGLDFVTPGSGTALREDVGFLNVHVDGCSELHVDYDFAGLGSRELVFTRLAGVQGRGCPD